MKKWKDWLGKRSPKQLLSLVVLLYALVIIVASIFFLLGKMNLAEVIVTLVLLVVAAVPIFKG